MLVALPAPLLASLLLTAQSPRTAAPASPAPALAEAQVPVPADLAVAGVVVGRTPERSSAILLAGGRTRTVGVGETAFGGRLVSVTAAAVALDFGGRVV
ncbi:MAG TPA: hypothetical protein VGB87_07725, partial [Vicinamibacteria bacterium]